MNYTGKLYGKIEGKYFDTGKTSKDWDKLEARANHAVSDIVFVYEKDNKVKILNLQSDREIHEKLIEYKYKHIATLKANTVMENLINAMPEQTREAVIEKLSQ